MLAFIYMMNLRSPSSLCLPLRLHHFTHSWKLSFETFRLTTAMARPQQRFRGVRQRHWGSWVSEIRHPLLKTRIWLGTFETAQDAARAYDEAARLMCGPKARTNFSYNQNEQQSSSSKLLSATLTSKLQKCYMASLQMAKKQPPKQPQQTHYSYASTPSCIPQNSAGTHFQGPEKSWVEADQQFQHLDDDDVEQMIQELLDLGSFELRSAVSS